MKKILLVCCVLVMGMIICGIWSAGRMEGDARIMRVEGDFAAIHSALRMFEGGTGAKATAGEGLPALVERPEERRWSRLMDEVPRDPWEEGVSIYEKYRR